MQFPTNFFALLDHYVKLECLPVWNDTKPAIALDKIIIIEEKEVVTDFFNFTDSAQKRNAENLVFISDITLRNMPLVDEDAKLGEKNT